VFSNNPVPKEENAALVVATFSGLLIITALSKYF